MKTPSTLRLNITSSDIRWHDVDGWQAIETTTRITTHEGALVWEGSFKQGLACVDCHFKDYFKILVDLYSKHRYKSDPTWQNIARRRAAVFQGFTDGELHVWMKWGNNEVCPSNLLPKFKAYHLTLCLKLAKLQKVSPKLNDVMHSLVMEGSAFFDGSSFEEWASDLGYDTDSRKAERDYHACKNTGRQLTEAFTAEELEGLREWASEY